MTDKWLVDPEHPTGRLVAMTKDEETQLAAERKEWAIRDAAAAKEVDKRQQLAAAFKAGTATDAQVQSALAELLG